MTDFFIYAVWFFVGAAIGYFWSENFHARMVRELEILKAKIAAAEKS